MTTLTEVTAARELKILIYRLRNASYSRNFQEMKRLFEPIWKIQEMPHFSRFEVPERAQLLKLAGTFLVNFGKAKNLQNYQERGKNVLTRAIDLFWELNEIEEAMECQMLLAIGYCQEGSIEEYQALLDDAESYFTNNKTHTVYLLIQINYLIIEISRRELKQALSRIDRIALFVEVSSDIRVKTLYYTQTGIVRRMIGDADTAVECFNSALMFAKACENVQYEAMITNCLANAYRSLKKYDEAMTAIDHSLILTRNDEGWTAHFLDTQANIHLDRGELEKASEVAAVAVKYFRRGDDFGGLTEALWTQMKIHFRLDLREIAFKQFFELYSISMQHSGSKKADQYLNEFLDMVYVDHDADFNERIILYKRFLVQNALYRANGKIVEAAKILGIKRHQTLSAMIRKNFPEVLEDYQMERKTRSDCGKK